MRTKIVEATNGPNNWGKFMVGRWDEEEWKRPPLAPGCESPYGTPLLSSIGWSPETFMLFDLQTGEGALFRHSSTTISVATVRAHSDLFKHKVWVCPLYEPFLAWLYTQDKEKVFAMDLPDHVSLAAPFEAAGYRRPGFTE